MKKTIEVNQRTYESQIGDLRTKHNHQVEQLNEELENVRKVLDEIHDLFFSSIHRTCCSLEQDTFIPLLDTRKQWSK